MKKFFALLLAAMLLTASAMAETIISVPGSSTVYVQADQAIISLGVSARDVDVQTAQSRVNVVIAAVRDSMTNAGCAANDVTTGSISVYANYDWSGDQEVLTGYTASATLSIRTGDINNAGTLIDLAFAAGANILNGIQFYATDTTEASDQALREAVANAAAQAQIIADAAGLNLTGIKEINKYAAGTYSTVESGLYRKTAAMESAAEDSAPTVVNAAQVAVTMSVTAVYTADMK